MSTEPLTWHSTDTLPDSDITVLLWVVDGPHGGDWTSGWWDGERWLAIDAFPISGTVTHWADPNGPQISPTT